MGPIFQRLDHMTQSERHALLQYQKEEPYSKFLLSGELVVYDGIVIKTKGLSRKRRHMLLTDFPRLIYYDPVKVQFKGEINWSNSLMATVKNQRHFRVLTPNRTYYLEDIRENPSPTTWVEAISF